VRGRMDDTRTLRAVFGLCARRGRMSGTRPAGCAPEWTGDPARRDAYGAR
jgi:hypothetical protein